MTRFDSKYDVVPRLINDHPLIGRYSKHDVCVGHYNIEGRLRFLHLACIMLVGQMAKLPR